MPDNNEPKIKKPNPRHTTTEFKYTKLHVKFSAERKEIFLQCLRETGIRAIATATAGICKSTLESHLAKDLEFKQAYEDAREWHTDNVIVKEAQRRAVEGVTKAVYGGRFKDEVVGEEQVYSDSLMALMLKARAKDFKPDAKQETGDDKGVLVILGTTQSPDDWAKKYAALADKQ